MNRTPRALARTPRAGAGLIPLLAISLALILPAIAHVQIDHRLSQSPVKHQGARGTCVAFAVCAAMETFPGIPTDISEQMTYAAVKLHQNSVDQWLRALDEDKLTISVGDTLRTYATLASILGACPEEFFPYNPNPRAIPNDAPEEVRRFLQLAQVDPERFRQFRMAMGKYRIPPDGMELLTLDAARDIERLKNELNAGRLAIPVIYQVHATAWSQLEQLANHDGDGQRNIIHPGMMHRFVPPGAQQPLSFPDARLEAARLGVDLIEELLAARWLIAQAFDPKGYGGHAVTIVGYDQRGFIIKNSWGTDWGDSGYARITFDYHRLYATEALLIDRATIEPGDASPFARTRSIREARWRLKAQPGIAGRDADGTPRIAWILSTWCLEPRDPDCDVIEYTIETRATPPDAPNSTDAAWTPLLTRRIARSQWPQPAPRTPNPAAPATPPKGDGMPLLIEAPEIHRLLAAGEARITVRYGYSLEPNAPDPTTSANFITERRFGPMPTNLRSALSFTPHGH
ncbi:MAG: C1 family peptidase [Phycisphaerales bacterium]